MKIRAAIIWPLCIIVPIIVVDILFTFFIWLQQFHINGWWFIVMFAVIACIGGALYDQHLKRNAGKAWHP